MHSTEPNAQSSEALRRENETLRRELEALRSGVTHVGTRHSTRPGWNPSKTTILALTLFILIAIVAAFFAGYLPMRQRRSVVIAETRRDRQALPRVQVVKVARAEAGKDGLQLPGSIQAINEAPILSRTDGYLKTRFVDLGDHVKAGQPLAEIDAPEMEETLRGARAGLEQVRASLDQAAANLEQGKSELELAKVSAQRWADLTKAGIASRQDDDKYRLEFQARVANVNALEKALNVQKNAVLAAEANVARMENLKAYKIVKAPFDGVITLRSVDAGALVSAGNTLLFRIAQTQKLRMYVSVPQMWVSSVRPGQTAAIQVSGLPGREFTGTVARTANALDPTSRTLLVEVNVPNPTGDLLPGMSVQVDLSASRRDAPLIIPADALVIRANGSEVQVVRSDGTVHLQKIQIGRDYGDRLEVLGGLQEGDTLVRNPGDLITEGTKVETVIAEERARQ
jgi:RND family efflux transporter MFP subunit